MHYIHTNLALVHVITLMFQGPLLILHSSSTISWSMGHRNNKQAGGQCTNALLCFLYQSYFLRFPMKNGKILTAEIKSCVPCFKYILENATLQKHYRRRGVWDLLQETIMQHACMEKVSNSLMEGRAPWCMHDAMNAGKGSSSHDACSLLYNEMGGLHKIG